MIFLSYSIELLGLYLPGNVFRITVNFSIIENLSKFFGVQTHRLQATRASTGNLRGTLPNRVTKPTSLCTALWRISFSDVRDGESWLTGFDVRSGQKFSPATPLYVYGI